MVKSNPAPPPVVQNTTLPEQKSERTFVNGQEVSSRIYDKPSETYNSNIYLDPTEQQILNTGKESFANLLPLVSQQVPLSEADRAAFRDQLYNPQAKRVEDAYKQTLGNANGAATAAGTANSIGFEKFRTGQLEKNKQEQLSSLYNQADLQSFDLPNLKLAPIISALSVFDTSINSPTNRGYQALDSSFTGSQAASNYGLSAFQAQNQALANQAAYSQQPQRRGFLGSLFF